MAGYSGTPLPQKLGIKANHRIALVNAPAAFDDTLGALPSGVVVKRSLLGRDLFDVLVFFATHRADVAKQFAKLARHLQPAGGLWIAWPKRVSGVPTDLTENVVRAIGLEVGLVDNKVCAVDETWSGLRFVIRLVDRPKRSSEARG
jgi:hypothetical protein